MQGEFRVLFIASYAEVVYVLHCFRKKTRTTSIKDLDIARARLRNLKREARSEKMNIVEHITPVGENIFAELNVPDAANEKLRLELLVAIRKWVNASGLNQTEAAKAMGVKQPTLNDAINGHYRKFTIDRLVRMLSNVGKCIDLVVTDKAA